MKKVVECELLLKELVDALGMNPAGRSGKRKEREEKIQAAWEKAVDFLNQGEERED